MKRKEHCLPEKAWRPCDLSIGEKNKTEKLELSLTTVAFISIRVMLRERKNGGRRGVRKMRRGLADVYAWRPSFGVKLVCI